MKNVLGLALISILMVNQVISEEQLSEAPSLDNPSSSPTLDQTTPIPSPTPTPIPTLAPSDLVHFSVEGTEGLNGRILFSALVSGYERIFQLDLDSKEIKVLVDGPGNNNYPSWAPDGRSFAFTSDRDGNKEIYIADWEGLNQSRVTINTVSDDTPSFAPDGKRMVYVSESKPSESNLFTINSDGTSPIQVTRKGGKNIIPRWSPDGRSIVFSTNRFWPGWDICVWDLKTQEESCPLSGRSSYCRGEWSHSGNFIAYSEGILNDIDIVLYDLKQRTSSQVTKFPGKEYDATWSLFDKEIAFSAENGTAGIFNIYIADIASNKVRLLVKAPFSIRYLSWSAVKTFDLEAGRIAKDQHAGNREKETQSIETKPIPSPSQYVPPYLRQAESWNGEKKDGE